MKTIAVIPARFAASRFPGKLMQKIGDKTIIRLVYENIQSMQLFDGVFVVTDHDDIFREIFSISGSVIKSVQEHQSGSDRIAEERRNLDGDIMSKKEHESGSDRIAEAILNLDADIIVNVQGDEPFVDFNPLKKLINSFEDNTVQVASIMQQLGEDEDINNPNVVKVVCDKYNNALYFSRSPIPYKRNLQSSLPVYKHVGVYGYRKQTLLDFTKWPMGLLEQTEMLEQLRYLENGINIKMVETNSSTIGIDTPEDLEKAKLFYANKNR